MRIDHEIIVINNIVIQQNCEVEGIDIYHSLQELWPNTKHPLAE